VYTRGASTAATIAANANVAFVQGISSKQNSAGKTVQMLSYYMAGETTLKSMLTEKNDTLNGISSGDLIRFAYEPGPTENGVTEKTSVLTGVQRVFAGGKLYDWKSDAVFETFLAEGNIIKHAYSSTSNYYEVVHGTLDSKMIEGGVGTINVVPMIVDNNDNYVSNWIPYNLTTSTKIYKWNNDEGKYEIVDSSYFVSVEDTNGDATSASKIVVIRLATTNTAKAIYLLG